MHKRNTKTHTHTLLIHNYKGEFVVVDSDRRKKVMKKKSEKRRKIKVKVHTRPHGWARHINRVKSHFVGRNLEIFVV